MADTPRRNAQANRQARRQSPYARPEPQQAQQTPSRLRSLLSYVSPFRSAAQKQPRLEVEEVQDVEAERSAGEEDDVKQEEDDGNNSADEAAQFALHGRLLAGGQQLNGAPATPSPANGGTFPRSAQFRSLAPSLSLTASSSLPNLAGAARSPRPALSASPNSATHELARFWQEKAERGEEHLSAIEQAGVLQLMQQAQTESTLPTAFTPNFRTVSPPRTSLPFPFTASDALSAPPSTLPASRAGSVFGGDAPSIAGSSTSTAGASGFKRRRPLYVGAGYSSRRRTSLAAGKAAASGLTKSQSESSLFSLAEPSAAEGKRRRTTEDEKDEEDDIPVARLDDVVALPASPAPSSRKAEKAKEVEKPKLHSQPPFSRFNTGVSTPAKPSPLWQVSQADTASPSPPRKATPSTPAASSATAAPATTLTPKTAAADLMLGIIAQSDAANPAGAKKAKVVVEKGKEAFLNPYANAEGEEDLLSLGGGKKERVPRSRAKVATPGRARAAKAEAAQKAAEKEKERKEKEKKAQEISPLEQLERTMPAEYRPSKRTKAASPPPAPAPAKKEKKEEPEVVEILSSDAEEEDEAMQQDEEQGEEEDQLEQEDEGEPEEEEDEIVIASPPPAAKKPAFSFGGSSSTSSAFGSSTTPSAGFGGFGFAPTPSPSSPSATSSAKPAAAPSSAFSFAVPSAAAKQKKDDKPATPSPVAAPSSSFAFSVPSPAPATTSSTTDAKDPKAAALALPRSALPLSTFSFGGVFPPTSSVKGDAAEEAVKKLVKEMGKGELPTFAF